MSEVHELKCWPDPYAALVSGQKTFEYRKDDRGFAVGDELFLREWTPNLGYSGFETRFEIMHIERGPHWGIPPGYVVMGVRSLIWSDWRRKFEAAATERDRLFEVIAERDAETNELRNK